MLTIVQSTHPGLTWFNPSLSNQTRLNIDKEI